MPLLIRKGKRLSYGRIRPVAQRDYVTEPYENNPSRLPGEAKASVPTDDEEFIPQQVSDVAEQAKGTTTI